MVMISFFLFVEFYFYVTRNLNKRFSDTIWYETFGNTFSVIPMTCHIEILVWIYYSL